MEDIFKDKNVIVRSNMAGVFHGTLRSRTENEVHLTIDKDGDEEIFQILNVKGKLSFWDYPDDILIAKKLKNIKNK